MTAHPFKKPHALEIPIDDVLDENIEIVAEGTLRPVGPSGSPHVTSTREVVKQAQEGLGTTLLAAGAFSQFFTVMITILQLWLMRLGGRFNLPKLSQPAGAKTKLVPAIDTVLANRALILRESCSALDGINTDELAKNRQRLLDVRRAISESQSFVEALQALESHLEQALDTPARLIHTRLDSTIKTNALLTRRMASLSDLVSAAAQEAAETRKDNKRRTERTRTQVLDEIKKEKEQAGLAQGQGETSAAPPVLLGTLTRQPR